jgi:hypothetical protein
VGEVEYKLEYTLGYSSLMNSTNYKFKIDITALAVEE